MEKSKNQKAMDDFFDCTDLNQCGARRDAELCRLCYIHVYIKRYVYRITVFKF